MNWTWAKAMKRVRGSKGRLAFVMSPDHTRLWVRNTKRDSRKHVLVEVTGAELPKLLGAAHERAKHILIKEAESETGAPPAAVTPDAPGHAAPGVAASSQSASHQGTDLPAQ
jgi:hypothetical protein